MSGVEGRGVKTLQNKGSANMAQVSIVDFRWREEHGGRPHLFLCLSLFSCVWREKEGGVDLNYLSFVFVCLSLRTVAQKMVDVSEFGPCAGIEIEIPVLCDDEAWVST